VIELKTVKKIDHYVDPENIIDEQNESNNKVFKSVTVSIWPDLSIEEILIPRQVFFYYYSLVVINNPQDYLVKNCRYL